MGIFPDAQGQLTLQSVVVSDQILNSSKLLWFSSFLLTCKNEEDPIKIEGAHTFIHYFSDSQGQLTA